MRLPSQAERNIGFQALGLNSVLEHAPKVGPDILMTLAGPLAYLLEVNAENSYYETLASRSVRIRQLSLRTIWLTQSARHSLPGRAGDLHGFEHAPNIQVGFNAKDVPVVIGNR